MSTLSVDRSGVVQPRGATGRADLLRLLSIADRDAVTLDRDTSGWFGYVRDEQPPPPVRIEPTTVESTVTPASHQRRRLPLRLPSVLALVQRTSRRPPPASAAAQQAIADAVPLDEEAARAPSATRLIHYEDLVPAARLLPVLRRLLGTSRAGPLDLEQLTQLLAAGQLWRCLPRRMYKSWHPDLVVMLDFCPRLWPYREDMHRLAERLLRQAGRSGVSIRIVNHGPDGPWSSWLEQQNRQPDREPLERAWTMPPVGAPVLIVSDLGMLLGPQSAVAEAWAAFVASLIRTQRRPLALVPLGSGQLGKPVPSALPILRWSPDACPRPARTRGIAASQLDGLDDLLAMVAATRRVDPPLLRAMRRLCPSAPLNAGLEGAVWCHADVVAGAAASIKAEAREAHLRHFRTHLKGLHAELDRQRRRHHAHLRAVLNHEETLVWVAHADEDVVARLPGAAARVENAQAFIRRLVATLMRSDAHLEPAWWSVAEGIVQRADARMWEQHADALHRLLVPQLRMQGAAAVIPEHADPAMLAGMLGPDQPAVACWLVQDAASGHLVLQAKPAGARQIAIGTPLLMDAGGVRVGVAGGGPTRWLTAEALPMPLAGLDEPAELHLRTARESLVIAAAGRPLGAYRWGWERGGLLVETAPIGSWQMSWSGPKLKAVSSGNGEAAMAAWRLQADAVPHPDAEGALEFGIEPRFGIYADLAVATEHGRASQRLRWIEPGTFLMGSPEAEAGRDDDESPQHPVTLTQGFWLADTACTQALWRAVTGSDPSGFMGLDRPVENVSWHDVQDFLRRLEALLPGCRADLPTEAEWEYACRAGTVTPFSFGETITTDEVNYNGNFPYAGGIKGKYREGTVPVKSLPPNPWGLYEMHGNVWEWCADALRAYDSEPQVDPRGPDDAGEDTHRAIRGGSWIFYAKLARSAYRRAGHPGNAFVIQGFRLCLRPGRNRPEYPAQPATGSRSTATPLRKEKPAQDSEEFLLRELFRRSE